MIESIQKESNKIEVYRPGTELFFVNEVGIRKFKVLTVNVTMNSVTYSESATSWFNGANCVNSAEKAAKQFLELLDGKI